LKSFKKVKKLLKRNANARDKILTFEQFTKLMGYLPKHTKEILSTGFYTGMRRGEILSLTWDKVDMVNRIIRLEAEDTKDREPRDIPICDELHTVLCAIPKAIHTDHVFLYKGRPVKSIRTSLKTACEKVGIPYGRFVKDGFIYHDLRHTFNTYMRKSGVPESVIMEITGHSTREMFDRYNTIDAEDTRNAVDQFGAYLRDVR
jgi:integrase